jgi:hypothetical protein
MAFGVYAIETRRLMHNVKVTGLRGFFAQVRLTAGLGGLWTTRNLATQQKWGTG